MAEHNRIPPFTSRPIDSSASIIEAHRELMIQLIYFRALSSSWPLILEMIHL